MQPSNQIHLTTTETSAVPFILAAIIFIIISLGLFYLYRRFIQKKEIIDIEKEWERLFNFKPFRQR